MESAKDAIKEPQPAEQASFSMMCSMTPSLKPADFMSWPPISVNVWNKCLSTAQVSSSLNLAECRPESLNQDALTTNRWL